MTGSMETNVTVAVSARNLKFPPFGAIHNRYRSITMGKIKEEARCSARGLDPFEYLLSIALTVHQPRELCGDWEEHESSSSGPETEAENSDECEIPQEIKAHDEQDYKFLLGGTAPFYVPKAADGVDDVESNIKTLLSSKNIPMDREVFRKLINNLKPEYDLPTLIYKKWAFTKSEEARNLGPGTYDLQYYDQVQKVKRMGRSYLSKCKEVCEVEAKPGSEKAEEKEPEEGADAQVCGMMFDPGYYGDRYKSLEAYYEKLKHPGKIPLFQSGPCNPRSGLFDPKGAGPGPGDYDPKVVDCKGGKMSECEMLKMRRRDRFDYYKRLQQGTGPGKYQLPTMKDILNSKCNQNKGKFSKLPRDHPTTGERIAVETPLWPSKYQMSLPGPAAYSVPTSKKGCRRVCWGNQNYWVFNSSVKQARPVLKSNPDADPGNYLPKKVCPRGCGWTSVFKSGSERGGNLEAVAYRVKPSGDWLRNGGIKCVCDGTLIS